MSFWKKNKAADRQYYYFAVDSGGVTHKAPDLVAQDIRADAMKRRRAKFVDIGLAAGAGAAVMGFFGPAVVSNAPAPEPVVEIVDYEYMQSGPGKGRWCTVNGADKFMLSCLNGDGTVALIDNH